MGRRMLNEKKGSMEEDNMHCAWALSSGNLQQALSNQHSGRFLEKIAGVHTKKSNKKMLDSKV